ncbi:hypothetical protein FRB96_005792 [Tulasnella sp. 330]|nr:hypothetical protein FRB96_005792 [Tulasnella sp. 330]
MKLSIAAIAAVLAVAASTVAAAPMQGEEITVGVEFSTGRHVTHHRGWNHLKCKIQDKWECLKDHIRRDREIAKLDLRHWKDDIHEHTEIVKRRIHHHIRDFEHHFELFKWNLEFHLENAIDKTFRHVQHAITDIRTFEELLQYDIIYHVYYMWEKLAEIKALNDRVEIAAEYRELVNQVSQGYLLPSYNPLQQSCEAPLLTIVDGWDRQKSQSLTIFASGYNIQITKIYYTLYRMTHMTTVFNPVTGETDVEQDSETVEQTEVHQTTIRNAPTTYTQGRTYTLHGEENRKYQEDLTRQLLAEGVISKNAPVIFEN